MFILFCMSLLNILFTYCDISKLKIYMFIIRIEKTLLSNGLIASNNICIFIVIRLSILIIETNMHFSHIHFVKILVILSAIRILFTYIYIASSIYICIYIKMYLFKLLQYKISEVVKLYYYMLVSEAVRSYLQQQMFHYIK